MAVAAVGCTFSTDRTGSAGTGGSSGSGTGGGGGRGGSGGIIGTTGGAGDVGSMDAGCGQVEPPTQNLPPDLLLILDKSGSMNNDFADNACNQNNVCDATNPVKWDSMTAALNTVITQTQASVNWGLKLFANDNQCLVNPGATIAIAPNNGTAMLNRINATAPGGRTPTAAAEDSGGAYMSTITAPNPKYILLATDGIPNCVGQNQGSNDPAAADSVTRVFNLGIHTFVIGVGNVTTAQTMLNSMATNGGEAQPADAMGRIYFPADNPDQLVAALTAITSAIASCNFSLGNMAPPDPTNIFVSGNGTEIPKDPTNGWSYGPGMTSVVLNGTYCDQVKAGTLTNLRVIFGCPGQPIVP